MKYFNNLIDSILMQTYKNWECLIIDDGSTNGCEKVCDELGRIDSRIKVIHTSNNGVSAARNRGIERSKGKYITFIDSDDTVALDYLDVLYKTIVNNNSDCVIAGCRFVYNEIDKYTVTGNNKEIIFKTVTQDQALNDLFYMRHPYDNIEMTAVWGTLYSAEILKKISFNEAMFVGEDFVFKYEFFKNAKIISYVDKAIYNYFIRDASIMRQSFNKRKYETFVELKKYIERADFFNKEIYNGFLSRAINIVFVLLLTIPENNIEYVQEENQIIYFLKKYRKKVLFNTETRFKVKIAILVSFISFKSVKRIMNLMNK